MPNPTDEITRMIANATSVANARVAKVDFWADAALYQPETVTGSMAAPLLTDAAFPALSAAETVPSVQFQTKLQLPHWQGAPLSQDIVDIITNLNTYAATYGIDAIGPTLQHYFDDFYTTYYPGSFTMGVPSDANGAQHIFNLLDQKIGDPVPLRGYLTGSPLFAPTAQFKRARLRVSRDGGRAEAEIAAWATRRGLRLPASSVATQQQFARQFAQDMLGRTVVDTTVRQDEMAIETFKFAMKTALEYRERAMQNAAQYLEIFTGAILNRFDASAYAAIMNARNGLYATSLDMYKSVNDVRGMQLKVNEGNRDADEGIYRALLDSANKHLQIKSTSAVGSATALAHVAAAALSGLQTQSSLGVTQSA